MALTLYIIAILFFQAVSRWDWIHVAQTYDGNSVTLYVNGEEKLEDESPR